MAKKKTKTKATTTVPMIQVVRHEYEALEARVDTLEWQLKSIGESKKIATDTCKKLQRELDTLKECIVNRFVKEFEMKEVFSHSWSIKKSSATTES